MSATIDTAGVASRRGSPAGPPASLSYAAITPARDEAENLRRLGASMTSQDRPPRAWVIVDDGSTDATPAVAEDFARGYPWISLVRPRTAGSGSDALEDGRTSGRDVVAFNTGLAAVGEDVDIVVKLDADVSLDGDFFDRLVSAFEVDPTLGIASGTCYEQEDGEWTPRYAARSHVRGATRAWRTTCLEEIGPLVERLGWDIVDEMTAIARGWAARPLLDLPFYHHRAVGARDGQRRCWYEQGETAWYVGYRPSYAVARALYASRRERAALAMVWGYVAAAGSRRPRHPDPAVRRNLRARQRLRDLPLRAREVRGASR